MVTERQDSERSIASELRSLSGEILREVDQSSFIEAGFLFRAYLDDFTSGSFHLCYLVESAGKDRLGGLAGAPDANQIIPELKPTARRLCQLSRDLFFSATAEVSQGLKARIEELFRLTASLIPDSKDRELDDYKSHIANRKLAVGIAVTT